jgi:hypothetical protein
VEQNVEQNPLFGKVEQNVEQNPLFGKVEQNVEQNNPLFLSKRKKWSKMWSKIIHFS